MDLFQIYGIYPITDSKNVNLYTSKWNLILQDIFNNNRWIYLNNYIVVINFVQMKPRSTRFIIVLFISTCYNLFAQQEKDVDDGTNFTIEEAQAIIDKYNLLEGSIILHPRDSINSSLMDTNPELAKSLSQPPLMPMTKAEFEKSVAELAAYQQSEKGQIAKKIGDFYRKLGSTEPTGEQLDSLYLGIDKEYGTDYWQQVRGPLPPGAKRYSSFDNKPMTLEP